MCSCKNHEPQIARYEINGNIINIPKNATIYLKNIEFADSTIAFDGKFRFEGKVEKPTRVLLSVGNSPRKRSFWLENDKIEISGTFENIDKLKVLGGKNQQMANLLLSRTKQILLEKENISNLITNIGDSTLNKDSLYALNKVYSNQIMQIERQFIKEHPNTLEGALLLDKHKRSWSKDSVTYIFDLMKPEIQKTKIGVTIKRYLELSKNPQIGETYIDFENKNTNGDKINLSQLRAKYTLIDFWASWCTPCRKENPNLVELFNRYKEYGFNIVGVSLDTSKSRWLAAIEEDNLPWDNLNDFSGPEGEVATIYDIKGIPDNILLDEKGIIIGRNLIGDNLKERLQELFKVESNSFQTE